MSAVKTITVIGATGNQGGSVARSLLQNAEFKVRAVTRNPNSEASQKLAALGAEVVRANGFDSDEILAAFQGSWGTFVNLNSDDKVCHLLPYALSSLIRRGITNDKRA